MRAKMGTEFYLIDSERKIAERSRGDGIGADRPHRSLILCNMAPVYE